MKKAIMIVIFLSALSLQARTLKCAGTEPFWGAAINTETGDVSITDLVDLKDKKYKTDIRIAAGTTLEYAFVATSKKLTLAVVSNETCNDGMSEETYTHSIIVTGKKYPTVTGCCK